VRGKNVPPPALSVARPSFALLTRTLSLALTVGILGVYPLPLTAGIMTKQRSMRRTQGLEPIKTNCPIIGQEGTIMYSWYEDDWAWLDDFILTDEVIDKIMEALHGTKKEKPSKQEDKNNDSLRAPLCRFGPGGDFTTDYFG